MFATASDFVIRAAKAQFAGNETCELWTIAVNGRVVGSVVHEGDAFRLTWFPGADPRLARRRA
jgi:hypothetical protein